MGGQRTGRAPLSTSTARNAASGGSARAAAKSSDRAGPVRGRRLRRGARGRAGEKDDGKGSGRTRSRKHEE
ncbi:hypothetical protein C3R44_21710, partial [Mycobacterium tuberculosis]